MRLKWKDINWKSPKLLLGLFIFLLPEIIIGAMALAALLINGE